MLLVDEDDVIQLVDRLEAENERRIRMLLEDDGREQGGFETVRASVAHYAAEAAERGSFRGRLRVVRQPVQVPLHVIRRPQSRNEAPFSRGKRAARRRLDRALQFAGRG